MGGADVEVRRFTGLANYFRYFVEGYTESAASLTALGSPTAAPSGVREPQADGGGAARELPGPNSSSCVRWSTACGPARVPTLLAGRRGASAGGLLVRLGPADGQPGDHAAQDDEHLNNMYARWLSCRGFADGNGPSTSTGERDAESQQELYSRRSLSPRPRRSRPGGARSRLRPVGDNPARGGSRVRKLPEGGINPPHTTSPGAGGIHPGAGMFIALAGRSFR